MVLSCRSVVSDDLPTPDQDKRNSHEATRDQYLYRWVAITGLRALCRLAGGSRGLAHRCVEDRCKNAGFLAGVREDLQYLLRGDRHSFFSG